MPADGDSDEKVSVRISGRGIDLEREISVARLPRLLEVLFGSPAPAVAAPAARPAERVTSVVEYLREKQPQTSADTILTLSGYLELVDNKRPFTREDLRRLLSAARLPEPANFPRDVGVCVKKGYIQPVVGGFQLTNSGLEMVRLPGALATPRGGAGRGGGE